MKLPAISLLLASSIHLWSQEPTPRELLPKDTEARFHGHAVDLYHAESNIETDLQLSIPDERLLLHLRHRGFPNLAFLIYNDDLYKYADSTLFMPDANLKSCSKEEATAEELLTRAMVTRLAANNYACFQILKELAPTPVTMNFERQAKDLSTKIFVYKPTTGYDPTEAEFLQALESIRALFDQLSTLPKLTPQQLADERMEVAVLSPREYGNEDGAGFPVDAKKWADGEVKWHRDWDHQGYLLAFSELSGSDDYMQLRMVVNLRGGIFEWNRPYTGSHFGPDSYESKLKKADFQDLKDFLTKLPPADAPAEKNHFVLSFLKDGSWKTWTFNSLGPDNLFEDLLKRMRHQAGIEQVVHSGLDLGGAADSLRGSVPSDGTLK